MSIENFQFKKTEKSNQKIFKDVKTPEELLSFMEEKIHYGFVSKDDRKIYSPEIAGWGSGEQPEIKIQKSEELLNSGYGNCWEQTELEKKWFSKNNYDFKTYLLMFGDKISSKSPAHTFLAYKDKDVWNWFENSYDKNIGIHEYDDLSSLISDVLDKIKINAESNGADEKLLDLAKVYEYNISLDDCKDTDDFLSQIKKTKEVSKDN